MRFRDTESEKLPFDRDADETTTFMDTRYLRAGSREQNAPLCPLDLLWHQFLESSVGL